MAVLFLLLAFLILVVLAAAGLENTDPSSATLFSRSFDQLTEGQLLVLAAGLGFLVALFLFLAFGASRTRRSRRKELKSRRRDAEGRVDELERENARLNQDLTSAREELDATERGRTDAVAERDRAEATVDRVRASATDRDRDGAGAAALERDRAETDAVASEGAGASVLEGPDRPGDRTDVPAEPVSSTRERLDDRTDVSAVREEHARAADEHAQAAEEHARAADDESRRR
jgi:TolA-binding protein